MKDQNKTEQNKDAKNPISSGIAPGPGEHLVDAASQPSIATSTPGDRVGASSDMTGSAGMDGTSLFGTTDSDQVGNTSRSTSAALQGAQQSQSSPYGAMDYQRNDAFGGRQTQSAGTMLQNAQDQIRRSPGAFLAGTVVAGFLLQRILKSSSARKLDRPYGSSQSDISGNAYGTDPMLDSERTYGIETAYAPTTGYGADGSAGYGTSSAGTMNRLTDRVRQASDSARTRLQSTTADAKARLNDVSHLTKTQYYRAVNRVDTVKEEQPLLIGAFGLALGAGLGAMMAVSRRENELLGGIRDNLVGKAKETAMSQVQSVKESAQRLAEMTKQEAQRKKEELNAALSQGNGQSGAQMSDKGGTTTSTAGKGLH